MKTRNQRLLTAALATAVAATVLWDVVPLPDAGDRFARIVEKTGAFSRELPLSESERTVFTQARVLKRAVACGREQGLLVMIDGTRQRHAVHDPTLCFRGAGWSVVESSEFPLSDGNSCRLVTLKKGTQTTQALYGWSDGSRTHASPQRYWAQTALRRLTLGKSGPEPVLFLLQPVNAPGLDWPLWTTHLQSLHVL